MAGRRTSSGEPRWAFVALGVGVAAVVLGVVVWAMKGSSDAERAYTDPKAYLRTPRPWSPPAVEGPAGRLDLSIEPVDGELIEGFQVGLRIEDAEGKVLDSAQWTDVVHGLVDDPAIDDFYSTVMSEPVPAGTVVVRADVALGGGGPPVDPDLEGDLPCRVETDIAEGETVRVQIRFGAGNCLTIVPVEAPGVATSTSEG